jgi:hypothetical protein
MIERVKTPASGEFIVDIYEGDLIHEFKDGYLLIERKDFSLNENVVRFRWVKAGEKYICDEWQYFGFCDPLVLLVNYA